MFKIHAYCCAAQYFAVPSIGAQRRKITPTLIAYIWGMSNTLHTPTSNAKKQKLQHKQIRTPLTLGIIRNQAYTITVYRHQHDFSLKHLNVQAIYMTAKRRCCVQRHLLLQIETRHPTEGTM